MHHHDCPCPPAHHCHTDDVSPHHSYTDDVVAPHHCHTDDVAPPMFFGPATMFSWPTATSSSSSRSYSDNARHDVRVDVLPPSTTDAPSCEDTPCGKCALSILGWLFWSIIIALIIYAIRK
ncbi:unnamed protein product [Miscanthus lutarioriparius]|uniref:Uncharacterized protein n=1 Tax=Miscanthus lutarioriparius TaxID=422564 RepID=A0A811MN85_9POAL|nr:unnamed protein product [Miscanthus lutarioriparius]